MTLNQKYLFWREWNLAKKWLMEHGTTPADAEKKRVRLICDALGYGKSMADWKRWTNAELDKCLAKFRAIHDGGNLNAQLDAEEQPEKRAGKAEAELRNLLAEIYPDRVDEDTEFKRRNILNAMVRKVCFKPIDECSAAEIQKVIGIFRVQQQRNEHKAANAIAAAHAQSDEVDDGDPF